jgi:HEAT repeat protein
VHGGSENRALLAEVYQTSTNVSVKKRVLQAWMIAGERGRIVTAATGEKDPELRAAAIQQLGVMGAHDELAKLYAQETVKDVKTRILQAMFVGGRADRLIELARSEPDPDLRRTAIRNLGLMGKEKTGAALLEIYGADRDAAVKKAVIEGMFLQSHAEALVTLARKESDPELKRSIVEKLSLMQGSKPAMDYLMELLK